MQVIPAAVNHRAPDLLMLWDPNPELAILFPSGRRAFEEFHWGAGVLDGSPCLILYLFGGEQAVEVYFPMRLPTGPSTEADVWDALLALRPERLSIHYGDRPSDEKKSVELHFAAGEDNGLVARLESFLDKTLRLYDQGERTPLLEDLVGYFRRDGDSCPVQF